MRSIGVAVLATGVLVASAVWFTQEVEGREAVRGRTVEVRPADPQGEDDGESAKLPRTPDEALGKGLNWLVSTQGKDGGWGQDGGETSYVREGENLETTGNDLANTAVAALALLEGGSTPTAGPHREAAARALEFVLRGVEQAPEEGLTLKTLQGTQIQRKLGPFIDTFLTAQLLSELDGETGDADLDERVRAALETCVRKIEAHQQADGSWNISGGWAPILGTSMASQSLDRAREKGLRVEASVLAKVDQYTETIAVDAEASAPASAGIELYRDAQVLEQLSRTDKDRKENRQEIDQVVSKLGDRRFQAGFGSMGGEEFFSYLNISDSLKRTGGEAWESWNTDIQSKLVRLQNEDGSWAGHHCITGRVAVTSAAVLTIAAGRS